MSGVFIQILVTCTLDTVTGSNLKRWLQLDNLLRSQVAQATTQTRKPSKTAHPINGPKITSYRKSRVAEEGRLKNMQHKEKSGKS